MRPGHRLSCGLLGAVLLLGWSCAADVSSGGGGRARLEPVPSPDLSRVSEDVRVQLRDRRGRLERALADEETTAQELAEAFGDMGASYLAAEFLDAADVCLADAMTLAPSDARWPHLRGHVARLDHDPLRAASLFEQALALRPDHTPSLLWLAELRLQLAQPEAAETLLRRAESLGAGPAVVSYGLGRVALAQGQFARAIEQLERALEIRPESSVVHYPLALAYRAAGDRARAEAHVQLRGDVDLQPDDPALERVAALLQTASMFEVRGARALEEGRWTEAVAELRVASERAPSNAFTHLNLGTALYMTGDPGAALAEFREAVRLSPGLAKAHYSLGLLEQERGDDQAAMAGFRAAVGAEPGHLEARLALADALRRVGRVAEALDAYDEIIGRDPAASQARFGRAMGLVRLGRYRAARVELESGTSAFPDQSGFAHALARVLAAAPDAAVRDGERALSLMEALMKREQTTLAMAETMAMALAETARFDEAVEWQRSAMASAQEGGRPDLARGLGANLQRYERQQPSRTPWADDDPVHRPGVQAR